MLKRLLAGLVTSSAVASSDATAAADEDRNPLIPEEVASVEDVIAGFTPTAVSRSNIGNIGSNNASPGPNIIFRVERYSPQQPWRAAPSSFPSATAGDVVLTVLVIQQDDYDWETLLELLTDRLARLAAAADSGSMDASASSTMAADVVAHDLGAQFETAASSSLASARAAVTSSPRLRLVTLRVVQTSWDDMDVGPCDNYTPLRTSSGVAAASQGFHHISGRCVVNVKRRWIDGRPVENGPERSFRQLTIFPDFVLIRNEVTTPARCFRHKLLGLLYANVPSMNSLLTVLLCADRPVLHAMLNRLSLMPSGSTPAPTLVGGDSVGIVTASAVVPPLPLIPQQFFPSTEGFFYGQAFPAVVKFGSAHAGVGKILIQDHHQMEDVRSLLVCTKEGHCLAEPFIEGAYDLRIQKIGPHIRVMSRCSVNGAWKTQTGTCILEELPDFPERYRRWIQAAARMFVRNSGGVGNRSTAGGDNDDDENEYVMDICTLDVIVEQKTGREYVRELNGTSSGLGHQHNVDNVLMAELLLRKLQRCVLPSTL